ncbi:hypothetical protein C8R48DRAFT_774120 [Suillus tomentosus]|nr:hypothetical protein C8R48DRAFT_774120 [Suillus tomentosus]
MVSVSGRHNYLGTQKQYRCDANNAPEDTSVPRKAIHEPQLVAPFPPVTVLNLINRSVIFGDWRELVHPLGGTYYYNNNKNAYTSANLRNYQYLQMLDDFVDASRASAKEDSWVLVVQPALFLGEQRFQYYYVVPNCRTIAWLEDLNGILLFRECIKPSEWGHKKLELEAQYWKHFEFFPHHFQMVTSEVRGIRREVICYLGEATILSQSTAASIFWTLDDMSLIITQLANIEELAEHDLIPETGIVFCCRILYMLRHHQYLNRHNQPEARLI